MNVWNHYPRVLALFELMRTDNGAIFLDAIESALANFNQDELESIAYGEEHEQATVMARMGHNEAKALEVILATAFDGVTK